MSPEPQFFTTIIKMAGILVLMIVGLWLLSWYAKKRVNSPGSRFGGRQIRILENCHMGVKKSISLVKVPGKVLVVGVTADNLSLLGELDETQFVVNEKMPGDEPAQSGFSRHFKKISSALE